MQGGDISNLVVPRLVIVWDGLLGILPSKTAEAKFDTYMRFKRYKRAINLYRINEPLAARIWDLTWRLNFSVDVVTFTGGDDFAEHVEKRIERENLPIGHVWFEEPHLLARSLAYRPDIAAVFDANPNHVFTYGSKGRIVSPSQPNLVGAL